MDSLLLADRQRSRESGRLWRRAYMRPGQEVTSITSSHFHQPELTWCLAARESGQCSSVVHWGGKWSWFWWTHCSLYQKVYEAFPREKVWFLETIDKSPKGLEPNFFTRGTMCLIKCQPFHWWISFWSAMPLDAHTHILVQKLWTPNPSSTCIHKLIYAVHICWVTSKCQSQYYRPDTQQ